MESTNSTSEDDEVIYDLTSEARARSTPIERPCSRSIGTVYELGQEVFIWKYCLLEIKPGGPGLILEFKMFVLMADKTNESELFNGLTYRGLI